MGRQERAEAATVRIAEAPAESRDALCAILDQSFVGIYRWHARRTLRSVRWVRQATQGGARVGLVMLTMLRPASGYIYYVAVAPSQRRAGLGGLLLEDALGALRDAGAKETFACIRAENLASLRLFRARGFARITLRDLIRMRGFVRALCLWLRMVVAPGEEVFRKVMDGP